MFLGPTICDTCEQPFKPGDVIWQCDGEPDWCFHASDCPGPPQAITAPSTDRQSGYSNESTKDGNRE